MKLKNYGKKKGETVFYASRNKGVIKGVEKGKKRSKNAKADPNWKEVEENKDKPKTHSSTSEEEAPKRQTVEGVDESLENILQELKERGIGNS